MERKLYIYFSVEHYPYIYYLFIKQNLCIDFPLELFTHCCVHHRRQSLTLKSCCSLWQHAAQRWLTEATVTASTGNGNDESYPGENQTSCLHIDRFTCWCPCEFKMAASLSKWTSCGDWLAVEKGRFPNPKVSFWKWNESSYIVPTDISTILFLHGLRVLLLPSAATLHWWLYCHYTMTCIWPLDLYWRNRKGATESMWIVSSVSGVQVSDIWILELICDVPGGNMWRPWEYLFCELWSL